MGQSHSNQNHAGPAGSRRIIATAREPYMQARPQVLRPHSAERLAPRQAVLAALVLWRRKNGSRAALRPHPTSRRQTTSHYPHTRSRAHTPSRALDTHSNTHEEDKVLFQQINSRWIEDLRPATRKVLEETVGQTLGY